MGSDAAVAESRADVGLCFVIGYGSEEPSLFERESFKFATMSVCRVRRPSFGGLSDLRMRSCEMDLPTDFGGASNFWPVMW